MYFKNNLELPSDIKKELSLKAQDVYRETFNSNYPQNHTHVHYDSEELAHEAAWIAVKQKFTLTDGLWS